MTRHQITSGSETSGDGNASFADDFLPESNSNDESSESTSELDAFVQAQQNVKTTVNRLSKLAIIIQNSELIDCNGKAERYGPVDENGSILEPAFESYAKQDLDRGLMTSTLGEDIRRRLLHSVVRRWQRMMYRRDH